MASSMFADKSTVCHSQDADEQCSSGEFHGCCNTTERPVRRSISIDYLVGLDRGGCGRSVCPYPSLAGIRCGDRAVGGLALVRCRRFGDSLQVSLGNLSGDNRRDGLCHRRLPGRPASNKVEWAKHQRSLLSRFGARLSGLGFCHHSDCYGSRVCSQHHSWRCRTRARHGSTPSRFPGHRASRCGRGPAVASGGHDSADREHGCHPGCWERGTIPIARRKLSGFWRRFGSRSRVHRARRLGSDWVAHAGSGTTHSGGYHRGKAGDRQSA